MTVQTGSLSKEKSIENTMLTFRLGKQIFALPITQVRQIIEMVTIIPVPQVKEYVEGVVNFHSAVVPVVNLRVFMHQPRVSLGLHTPLVLVNLGSWLMGLIVDEVLDVLNLPTEEIISPRDVIPEALGDATMLKGVIREQKGMIMVLDLLQLFPAQQTQFLFEKASETILSPVEESALAAEPQKIMEI